MQDEYFPIQTKTACKSKWAWSTIWLYDGTTASCHRCDRHEIDLNDFDNFHNTPDKIVQRKMMLNGMWPVTGGCDYCQKVEDAGGHSDRQFQNTIPNQTPPELFIDHTATHVTPTILEIFLSNTCNLQCIYCRPANSSKIEAEFNKHGPFKAGDIFTRGKAAHTPKVDQELLKEKFWDWMARNSNSLRRFHILGGEPLFMKDFQLCLDHWDKYPNPLVEVNVVSNLSIPHERFKEYIDYIKTLVKNKKIKRFDMTASIDCWGKAQEYVRMGLDLELFEKNMNYLLAQDESWLRINVNQTVGALTIKTMPALIVKINEWKNQRTEFGHYFQVLDTPALMRPTIFAPGFFQEDFEAIMSLMKNETWDEKHAYEMMQGMIAQIESEAERNCNLEAELVMYLDEIDERRNTNWHTAFPWLAKLIGE